jgi:RNA polymerase subunit RPABC4/transcription elongation factor Spt4
MERLVVCAGCARHVRSGERACPYCGEQVARSTIRARLGTAVIVTASLVGPACGSSSGSDQNDVERDQGGEIIEPGDVVIDMRQGAGGGAVVVDAGPPAAAIDAGPPEEVHDIDRDRLRMPYGAPPARARMV